MDDDNRQHDNSECGELVLVFAHAINSSFQYSYDANGNMASRLAPTRTITWTNANYPTNVSGPGEASAWTYGPNRQIYKSYQQGSGGDETTFHIGALMEDVTFGGNSSNYRHYIMAGNELVAIYSRTFLGVNTLNYIQSDQQGSIASITTSSPAIDYVNESFTAFGNRRNGETWSGAPTSADETAINGKSRWGYTGHTAIGINMGLVHMNGRIEDATMGRFLSPDPSVPNPSNTQSYNRYSYVINNPLTRIDPTGFEDICGDDGGDCPDGGSNGGGGGGSPPPPPSYDPIPEVGCGIGPNGPCYTAPPDVPSPGPTPSAPPVRAGGGANSSKAPPLKPAQSRQPKPPCMSPAAAQSNRNSNTRVGAAAGFSIAGIAGGIFAANLVGFPEVEAAEAGAGVVDLVLVLTETRGADAIVVGAVTAGAYGGVAGGAVGAALPSGGCH